VLSRVWYQSDKQPSLLQRCNFNNSRASCIYPFFRCALLWKSVRRASKMRISHRPREIFHERRLAKNNIWTRIDGAKLITEPNWKRAIVLNAKKLASGACVLSRSWCLLFYNSRVCVREKEKWFADDGVREIANKGLRSDFLSFIQLGGEQLATR